MRVSTLVGILGVGQNDKPRFNKLVSEVVNTWLERLITVDL